MKPLFAIVLSMLLVSGFVFAQPAPPSPNGPPPNAPPGAQGGRPDGNDQTPEQRMRDRRQQEMSGQGDGQNPPPAGPMRQYEMMKQYLDLVDRYSAVARDPTNAGIAAVVAAVDTLRPRGSDAAIDYFNKLLPEVKDQAVARAIKAQLADLYRQSGQQDKALEELKSLIVNPNGDAAAK